MKKIKVSLTHNNSKRVLEGPKSCLLTHGLQATHELGGLNVEVQNITSMEI